MSPSSPASHCSPEVTTQSPHTPVPRTGGREGRREGGREEGGEREEGGGREGGGREEGGRREGGGHTHTGT